jgi:8-oxo-dGTP pyrophosphatase MutT (NUDIX family)/phosphohistidine phosphatase SixA
MPEPPSPRTRDVIAAGAVVLRRGQQVLLVHRPRYDDWSFPKGKLDPGEHVTAAAVREVAEETGLHVRLGAPLTPQAYLVAGGRTKVVHYWVGRSVGDDDVSGYLVNSEIDDLVWVPVREAPDKLTYSFDRVTLAEAVKRRKKTQALIVLRHGDARARKSWRKDDRLRPLLKAGTVQAERLVPVLAAYDVTTIASSTSTRCVQTVAPYAELTGFDLDGYDGLSEEDASKESVDEVVEDLLDAGAGAVLCTHRPVLPMVFEALGLEKVKLEPGGLLVVHHRKGRVLAVEQHRP